MDATGELRPAVPDDAATVAGWARTAAELSRWCGRADFPLAADVVREWMAQSDVRAFALVVDGRLTAYGELWLDADDEEVELARLIVDPARRGAGVGRRLTALLGARAREVYGDVFMRVHPDNPAALRSYAAAGFVPVAAADAVAWNVGQPVEYRWLRLP